MAGYSSTPLPKKLGIKEHSSITVINPPDNYSSLLSPLPTGVKHTNTLQNDSHFLHFFTKEKEELIEWFPKLKKHLAKNGILWISWPKGTSNVPTDLTENIVRDIGLAHRLVDVKVCAIDAIWSGLKFVYRLQDRS